ncbi:MAG TPA: DUF2723 domain-containing protein [Kofleriaceae bacterium]|nr:DUF2723 domain-containing protein [Kofleriaceae bacterium]
MARARLSSKPLRERLARIAFDRGGLLGLAALAVYCLLAPAHVIDGDNAEFATLGTLGGIAHPTGYPLYVLWLRAWSWLPGTPAHRAALATALLGALSIVVLHAACRAWGARPLAATCACAIFAASPLVLAIYSEAEVFALNGLVVGAVLWLAARGGPLRGAWRAGALGLVAGLGICDHATCVLVAPVGLVGVVRAVREARPAVIGLAVGGFALGLVPYAYVLVAPDNAMAWGVPRDLDGILGLVTRRDYGGPGAFAAVGATSPATANLAALAASLGRVWLWLPGLAGLAELGVRIARKDGRWDAAALAASLLCAGPLLVLRFNAPDSEFGHYEVARFHLLPALLLAIPVAWAADRVVWPATLPSGARGSRLYHAAALTGFAALAGLALPRIAAVHAPAVEFQAESTLRALPEDAIVFGVDDDLPFAFGYCQLVLGERTDVRYIHLPLTGLAWYRARMAIGEHPIEAAIASGRPVFAQPFLVRGALARLPYYAFGPLIRLLPPGQPPPPLAEVAADNERRYAGFELGYPPPHVGDGWPAKVHERYAATWRLLASQLDAAGDAAGAARALELARQIGPQP